VKNTIIPKGYIVFISGVPGSGKTTISYNLLKKYHEFRIIEETDLLREILIGYNQFLIQEYSPKSEFIKSINITDHKKLLTLDEAIIQCNYMKKSIEKIIERQQRKGIPTIINGVHIIPSVLNGVAKNKNIIYINLYINNERNIYKRIQKRDPNSYMLEHTELIYKTNNALFEDTKHMCKKEPYLFYNIDITNLTIDETLKKIINCINNQLNSIFNQMV